MMRLFTRRKIAAFATVGVLAIGGGVVYAYYAANGSGSGSGTAGAATAPTINQAAAVCGDYSAWNSSDTLGVGTCNLFPGTTQTVHLTATNNGKGFQQVNGVTLSGWAADATHATGGCTSAALPGSFTLSAVSINKDLAAGATSSPAVAGTITFVDTGADQSACEGATITFSYASS